MAKTEEKQPQTTEQDQPMGESNETKVNEEFYSDLPRGNQYEEADIDEDMVDMGERSDSLTESTEEERE